MQIVLKKICSEQDWSSHCDRISPAFDLPKGRISGAVELWRKRGIRMFLRVSFLWAFMIMTLSTAFAFDLQGHRGARGLAPENTLPAFAKALSIGVTTLELDTAVSKARPCDCWLCLYAQRQQAGAAAVREQRRYSLCLHQVWSDAASELPPSRLCQLTQSCIAISYNGDGVVTVG